MAKLKVYHCNLNGKQFGLVATTSQKRAAELLGISLYYFRDYSSITGNSYDEKTALSQPETPFIKMRDEKEWRPKTPNQ